MNGVRIQVGGSFITKHTNRRVTRDGESVVSKITAMP